MNVGRIRFPNTFKLYLLPYIPMHETDLSNAVLYMLYQFSAFQGVIFGISSVLIGSWPVTIFAYFPAYYSIFHNCPCVGLDFANIYQQQDAVV